MTQNAENAIRNGIKYLQPCLSTLLPSPCSSDLMILVNTLSDVPAFLQHLQTHSNVFYFPVLWNRQFTLPGNFLFSAFWEALHCSLSPYLYSILQGCQSLLGFTASRELLCPPIFLAALGDEGDGSPDIPWLTVTLLASTNRLPPPASWEILLSLRTYRGVQLWFPRGVPRASELIFCVGPDELEEGRHSQFQVLIWTPDGRISALFAWCSGPVTANLYPSHKNSITVPVLLFLRVSRGKRRL